MSCPDRRRGFTLIEVVVALAVVAIGMLAVFRVIGDAAGSVEYLRDRTLAGWIADNRITELRLAGELPSVDESGGDLDYAGRHWHWTAVVSQTPVDGLRRVDVRVRLADAPEDSALATLAGFIGAAAVTSGPSSASWSGGSSGGAPAGTD